MLADPEGKGRRIRTGAVQFWGKQGINVWMRATATEEGRGGGQFPKAGMPCQKEALRPQPNSGKSNGSAINVPRREAANLCADLVGYANEPCGYANQKPIGLRNGTIGIKPKLEAVLVAIRRLVAVSDLAQYLGASLDPDVPAACAEPHR